MKPSDEIHSPLVLFDGVCNYCSRCVNFIIRHDRKGKIKFAPFQSETGKVLLEKYAINEKTVEGIVLLENNTTNVKGKKVFIKSTAALRLFKYTDGGWKAFSILIIFPACLRDCVYDWIARNRYKWFGIKDQCMTPDENIKGRFIL